MSTDRAEYLRLLIQNARRVLDDDSHLANYMLRDLKETKAAGLSDLAWALHKGTPHKKAFIFVLGISRDLNDRATLRALIAATPEVKADAS